MGIPCVENAIYTLRKLKERENALTQLFQNAVKFYELSLIDDSITRIQLSTTVDDDSFRNTHNHYVVHHSLGPVLGFSLEALRCVVDKDDDSTIDYPPLQAYQAKYPSLPITNYSDIVEKQDKIEKLQDGVYKTQDRNGRLLLYKEPKVLPT